MPRIYILYSSGHDLASTPKFQIRYAHPISLSCHQLYKGVTSMPQTPPC